jgi:hypothetical protein
MYNKSALRKLEEMLESRLTEADRSDVKSGAIRWEEAAEWQLYYLRREGLVEPVAKSRYGVWKLTAKGKELATQLTQGNRY